MLSILHTYFYYLVLFAGTPLLPSSFDHFNSPQLALLQSSTTKLSTKDKDHENNSHGFKANRSSKVDDSSTSVTKENVRQKSTSNNNNNNIAVSEDQVSFNGRVTRSNFPVNSKDGIAALQQKHSPSRFVNNKKQLLLRKALELKSKSIRGSRLSSRVGRVSIQKRVTRSTEVRRQRINPSPDKRVARSLERKERAERRGLGKPEELSARDTGAVKKSCDARPKNFNNESKKPLRSRSGLVDENRPRNADKRDNLPLRSSRIQLSPAAVAARKKAKLAIRPKPKMSRLLLR